MHSSESVCENTEVINPIKFTCQILLRLKCRLSANDSKARCTRATLWYFSHTNIYISCVLTHHSDWTTVCSLLHMGSYLPHTKTDIYKQKSSMLSAVKLCNCFLCWNSHWHAFFFCEKSLKVQSHLFFSRECFWVYPFLQSFTHLLRRLSIIGASSTGEGGRRQIPRLQSLFSICKEKDFSRHWDVVLTDV